MSSVSPFKYSKNIMWIKVIIEKFQTLKDRNKNAENENMQSFYMKL